MTRGDVTVGVAAALAAVAAVGAFLLVVAAGRADRRARHADRAQRAAAVDAVVERFTTPAAGVHREAPLCACQCPSSAHGKAGARPCHGCCACDAYDPAVPGVHREPPTIRVPAQYAPPPTEVLPARSLHSTPIDPARAEQLLAEIGEALAASADAASVAAAAACCPRHYAPECRRVAVCCGACPTLPVS